MRVLFLSVVSAATLLAATGSGGGTGGGGTGGGGTGGGGTTTGITAPNAAEVRSLNARVPSGTTFQAQFLLTQPRPIGSAGSRLFIDSFQVNGVAIFSPLGDAAGAAVWQNGFLTVNVVSPNGDYGSNLDYPYMTVTMTVPPTVPSGSAFPLDFVSANYVGPTGPYTITDPKPGVLTVGGSISIHNVTPGGGTWPSGTVVTVEGSGFSPATKITAKMRLSPITYVSPTELRFTLLDSSTTMDMLALTAQNPDGSQVTYYSYLRGQLVNAPSRPLLHQTDPVFQSQLHGVATFHVPALGLGQFEAIAVQNPTTGPVSLSFQLQSTGAVTMVTLPSGGRLMNDISSLLGTAVAAGDSVVLTATSGVQILGLLGDETQGTVTPFLPVF